MGLTLLTERYAPQIAGVLSCWDRILLFGTLPKICFAEGMTSYLYERKIRIFDYPKFAEPFRNAFRRGWYDRTAVTCSAAMTSSYYLHRANPI